MIPDKIRNLILKLEKLTEAGLLDWDQTNRPTEFVASFKSGRVTCDAWIADSGADVADFAIYNDNGEKIESLVFSKNEYPLFYDILYDMYNTIHRKYMKVDETIDGIFSELEDKITF